LQILANIGLLDQKCYRNKTLDQIIKEYENFETYKEYRIIIQKTQTIAVLFRDGYEVSQEKWKKFLDIPSKYILKRETTGKENEEENKNYFAVERESLSTNKEIMERENGSFKEIIITTWLPDKKKCVHLKS
jgi:hypothetical protein